MSKDFYVKRSLLKFETWFGLAWALKKTSTVELDSISFKSCLSKAVHLCISLSGVNC